ncbi:hypothetical protein GK047_24470 [Paenibacillus sp. SYP-B3998]|uniref:Uncharacterized protein n=1 Tax=Paenibacillus sp. SYP-B3998 TaxID=2678564 RepID=A0A6G4A420_9BACL|nr:hypothetical protein [Paenibacillus sp. SYP-B3998]NEW09135.1 hypothetical protein [Paenibacillus sp. SYP-B3998]
MKLKYHEDVLLTQSLNKLLDEMPLLEPSGALTDRVMRSIHEPLHARKDASTRSRKKSDLVNGLVAAAATILLIQSGIVSRILTLDTEITQLSAYIHQISQILQS